MAWYNENWTKRKKIIIDNTKVDANLSDFPVYLDLEDLGSDFFDDVKSEGADIRITTSDGETEVPREVVSCDTTEETGEVHFKGTLSSSSDTEFYIYYGNSSASEPSSDATYGSENVWDSNYKAVYHLDDANDSTSNDNDGSTTGTSFSTSGKVGGAIYNSGGSSDKLMSVSSSASLISATQSLTFSCWMKVTSLRQQTFPLVMRLLPDPSAPKYHSYALRFDSSTGEPYPRLCVVNTADANKRYNDSTVISTNTWYYVVGTYDGSDIKYYFDGSYVGKTAQTGNISFGSNRELRIADNYYGNGQYYTGYVDEVRIINEAKNANWISTEYNNQNSPSTFYSIEEDVSDTSKFFAMF
jgi:hypothetical protein